jgi:lysophospholipase L1-like esterase
MIVKARRSVFILAAFAALQPSLAPTGEIPPPLREARRIVFLGDSITQGGDYVTDFDCWLVSRGIDIEVLNLGLASETAADLTEAENAGHKTSFGFGRPFVSERLDRALAKTRPDVVIACYGMNDGGSLPDDETGTRRFAAAMTRLRDAALKAGARRVLLCTPPVEDEKGRTTPTAHDEKLARYSAWLLSKRADGWDVADIHGPMRKALDEGRAKDRSFVLAGDGVHPGREGHWLMAKSILEGWLVAKLEGVPSAEGLFASNGKAIRDLVHARMAVRFSAWMSDIGHGRPGVPGGPGAARGPSIAEANAKAAEIAAKIGTLLKEKSKS